MISFFACEWVSPERAKARPDSHAKKEITTTKSHHKDTVADAGTVAGTDPDAATDTDTDTDTDTGADAGTGTGTGTVADAGRMEGPGTYYRTLTTIAVMLSRPPREFAI